MNAQLPVLIAGAGPTGLLLACELSRRGIDYRIIDKKSAPTTGSNATWIQSRTLELLDHAGLASSFIRAGHACDAINLHVDGKHLVRIPLDRIDSVYPFILMLPQSETELILSKRIQETGRRVERSTELLDVKQDGSSVTASLRNSQGEKEIMHCRWLIACDGASSKVRECCHIVFPGEDLTEQFVVADAHIDSFMTKNEAHLFFDEGTLFSASPLGANNYRIAANLHLDHPRKTLYEKEIIELVQERGHGAYYVKDISWISSFWVHGKLVDNMRVGSVFLAGDAAHVHSPAGGQGMNAGMQDAYNLAWKLALVIQGKAREELLESYHAERHPVANEIVNLTEQLTKLALYDPEFLNKLRTFSEKIINGNEKTLAEVESMISQTGIHYLASPVIDYGQIISGHSPGPGDRLPDVMIDKQARLYDILRHPLHSILLFTGTSKKDDVINKLLLIRDSLENQFGEYARSIVIAIGDVSKREFVVQDNDGGIHKQFHIEKPAVLVIRPDCYVGYSSENPDFDSIAGFMSRYIISQK